MALYGETDLVMTRDEAYTRTLNYNLGGTPLDWSAYDLELELRDRAGVLLGDLTPYLRVGEDPTDLQIAVPGAVTALLPKESRWDILAVSKTDPNVAHRIPKPPGRVLVRGGVTMRG